MTPNVVLQFKHSSHLLSPHSYPPHNNLNNSREYQCQYLHGKLQQLLLQQLVPSANVVEPHTQFSNGIKGCQCYSAPGDCVLVGLKSKNPSHGVPN